MLVDAAMRPVPPLAQYVQFFANNRQFFLRFANEKPPETIRISSLANFLSKHNPSTILHNPSTILHNPSTILHNPSTTLHKPSTVCLLTPPKPPARAPKARPSAFPDSLSANAAFYPRKMKQVPQTKREEMWVAMKGKFCASL
ncbi:MAG: hypothetical protein ACYCOR_14760 [Acidobacteriaceae bacterium]